MTSAARGNAAEAAVLHGLIRQGLEVFVPFGSGHPFDLAVYVRGGGFLRIQCKRAWPVGACVVFNTHSTDHGSGPKTYIGIADLFGVYFPPTDQVFLVPVERVAAFEGRLRLTPALNNRRKRIRFAADFLIERWTEEKLRALST
jgi:hypothetical protein